jgi:hypothetical protein
MRKRSGWWNYSNIPIDKTKTYRSSVWIKKTWDTNGSTYHWCLWGVLNLNGTTNSNPYFWAWEPVTLDQWYLHVGYIHPEGYTETTSFWWRYTTDSLTKIASQTDFKFWPSSPTNNRHRAYLYYNTNSTNRQYFYNPRFEEINPSTVGDVKDLLPVRLN